jgi:tetratricopeptide (TPR) repeat protein
MPQCPAAVLLCRSLNVLNTTLMGSQLTVVYFAVYQGTPSRQDVASWLCPVDAQTDFLQESSRRTHPCGQWLLNHQNFQDWLKPHHDRILLISGPPGSGKSVLSTSIIERTRQEQDETGSKFTAYFYCSKTMEQKNTTLSIMATLIAQILAQREDLPLVVIESYNASIKCGRSKISMADHPLRLLKSLSCLFSTLFVVVDGVDETQDPEDTVKTITELINGSLNVRITLLTRDIPNINKQLHNCPILRIRPEDTRADIDTFISHQLSLIDRYDPEFQTRLFGQLSKGAEGNFLWASLMIQSLRSATSLHDAIEVMSSLPIGLDVTYTSIIKGFHTRTPTSQKLTRKILIWMSCSARSLRWEELMCALVSSECLDWNSVQRRPFDSAILELCSPLVEYLPDRDVFRFVHISVREFLLNASNNFSLAEGGSGLLFSESDAHSEIADLCLTYLSGLRSRLHAQAEGSNFCLHEYATSFWAFHLVRSSHNPRLESKMRAYLSSRSQRLTWIAGQIFCESSGFPLQHLIKMQKDLCVWASSGDDSRGEQIDWIKDVEQLLRDIDAADYQIHPSSEVNSTGPLRVTYFEKLMVIRDLSREYTMRDRLDECVAWMTEALRQKELRLGPDHLSAVWLLNSLGIVYDQQRKSDIATATQEKALLIQESELGRDHPETVWTINELGRMYRHLGRTQDAIAMHTRALQTLQRSLPEDDLQLAWTMNTLARAYRVHGDPAKAISLHEEAITIQGKTLAPDHPHILWAMADIGRCIRDQGNLTESAEFHRKCLDGRKRVLGFDHADTLWAMNDLGLVLAELGSLREARELHQQAIRGQTLLLGESHHHTIWSMVQIQKIDAQLNECLDGGWMLPQSGAS